MISLPHSATNFVMNTLNSVSDSCDANVRNRIHDCKAAAIVCMLHVDYRGYFFHTRFKNFCVATLTHGIKAPCASRSSAPNASSLHGKAAVSTKTKLWLKSRWINVAFAIRNRRNLKCSTIKNQIARNNQSNPIHHQSPNPHPPTMAKSF